MLIHKVSIEKANRLFSNDMTGPPRIRHTVRLSLTRTATLTFIRNTDPAWLRCPAFDAFPLNARAVTFFTIRNLNQTRYDATSVVEKNKIETGRLDEQRYRVFIAMERGARTVSVPRFLVFPAAANHAVEKCTSLLLSSWMTGRRDPGREPRRKKKRDKRSGSRKRKKKKMRKKERRRSFIYHPAKWARWTGLETSRLPLGGCASLGHNLQFLTIRLDQPPYKRTYYVTTLRQDSHERLDAR